MSGLRFLMLTTFYPPHNFGGDGIGIQRLSRALAARGHHVTVVHDLDAFNALHRGPEPEPQGHDDGVTVRPVRSGLGILSPLLTQQLGRPIANGRTLRAIVGEGNFDVIQFNNVSLIGGPGLLRIGGAAPVKLYEAHEHWLVCPTHVLWRHNREACPDRECLACTLRHKRPPQIWRATGYLERELQHVDAFIAKSEFSRKKHHEFGFPREMNVVPYFLPDPDPHDHGPPGGRPHDRPYFLFVGRLERIKGLDDVIPTFSGTDGPDLVIAGSGEYETHLRALAAGLPRVRFLGRVRPEQLRCYYEHATALIVPSICFETFGIILIEAFRYGAPVIARRIGPFPEIVERSGGGMLFDNAADLVRAMGRMQDRPYRDGLARAGHQSFLEEWTESNVVPRYLDLVRSSARRKGNQRVSDLLSKELVT